MSKASEATLKIKIKTLKPMTKDELKLAIHQWLLHKGVSMSAPNFSFEILVDESPS